MRNRRVCILRLPNAINLTSGFSVCVGVCVGESQTQGKKVNINGLLSLW